MSNKLINKSDDVTSIGYLFVFTKNNELSGYISESNTIEGSKENQKIFLTEKVINQIIEQDEVFGVLVGGEYLYYAMPIILADLNLSLIANKTYLEKGSVLILFEDENKQKVII
ncbi:hypothetical protein [Photorhabdus namnaonensis]|uniref:Uncharacterized protein n=1 Tax=Photorhabdus namnaonensis TaxID=1851568 RepID=A0A1B8YLR8_9GAMM|nr:hypothetical protein [Photorhabdus namnaonensis]OCA56104.1 hypothetical protein Phpb_00603 [Photorhabdus namnaonensis]